MTQADPNSAHSPYVVNVLNKGPGGIARELERLQRKIAKAIQAADPFSRTAHILLTDEEKWNDRDYKQWQKDRNCR